MPDESGRLAETQAWLAKASTDLRAAEHDLQAIPPLLEDSLFHSQQAAEKALKGLLTWHNHPFRKTQDLGELGQVGAQLDPSLEFLCRQAARLTIYAWIFRYPGDSGVPTSVETKEALTLAKELVQAVLARIAGARKFLCHSIHFPSPSRARHPIPFPMRCCA
jgi:HEPN domain-containing protein